MREYLRKLRAEQKASQAEVSQRMGISKNYYSTIERGNRQQKMDLTLAGKLAAAFNVPMQTITDAEAAYIATEQRNTA